MPTTSVGGHIFDCFFKSHTTHARTHTHTHTHTHAHTHAHAHAHTHTPHTHTHTGEALVECVPSDNLRSDGSCGGSPRCSIQRAQYHSHHVQNEVPQQERSEQAVEVSYRMYSGSFSWGQKLFTLNTVIFVSKKLTSLPALYCMRCGKPRLRFS